ncbi:MAG TPA: AAA family ATPase, partial [Gammaproteobacteria bacterium]|nr:AAA family ATPase [Gammaproteobacteria bacterium]
HGRTVDFRNTVIVMTSNLGSDRIQELMSDGSSDESLYETVKTTVLDVVVGHFSPEFVNRIDETVVFHPLGQSQIRGIAELQLELLNQRLKLSELSLKFSTTALDQIANLGYDPVYGARPLKRAIQNCIENPLAQEVLKGTFLPGDIISLDLNDEAEFVFEKG